MDQKLARYFASLKEETEAVLRGSSGEVSELIADISRLCDDLVTDEHVSFATALVFDPENGVFSVVESLLAIRDRRIQKARENCLSFVADFVKKIGARSFPYASFIKDRCLHIFRRDESKSVQAAALTPLISLLELSMQLGGSFEFPLDRVATEALLFDFKKSKTSGTLRSNVLVVLGYAVESSPHMFDEESVNVILKLCLDVLDEQLHVKGKDPLYLVIAGAIKCLDALLTWFDEGMPAGGSVDNAKKIYSYLEQVIYFREDLKRYDMVKAGLHLLSRHARLFRFRLVENLMDILEWLEAYCTHGNAQLRDAAFPAFNAFISEVAFCLASDQRVKNPKQAYKRLIEHALGILNSGGHDLKLVSTAIRTIGKLSSLLVKYSGKEALHQAFHRLVSFSARTSRSTEMQEESMGYSVILAGAFADMIHHVDDVENYMVVIIAEAVGNIFFGYPYLFQKQKNTVYVTLRDLFKAFYSKRAAFSVFLSNIVWSSLERAVEPKESSPQEVEPDLWKYYVELWSQLLKYEHQRSNRHSTLEVEQISDHFEDDSNLIQEQGLGKDLRAFIFDQLLKCIIRLMTELNLKYKVKSASAQEKNNSGTSEEIGAVEPDSDEDIIEPLNPVHMKKFLNLVEFVQHLLSDHFGALFLKWVYPFGSLVIELSCHYPLISGFYKLLDVTIRTADRECYFNASNVIDSMKSFEKEKDTDASIKDVDSKELSSFPAEQILCQNCFRKYLQDVVVASRRYKLELLASCLHLCLSAPPVLMGISYLLEPMRHALKIGLRYSPLAVVAIDALEKWHRVCPNELEPFLTEIVPWLSNYLYESEAISGLPEYVPVRRPNSGNIISARRKKMKTERIKAGEIDTFELTQLRIQKFLGRVGKHCHALVPDLDLQLSGTGGLAWDIVEQVKFTLPFKDEKPDIWLDHLLPRIVELSTSSSDRRTKVAACELLHAVCVLMTGNAAKGPIHRREDSDNVHYEKIYKRIFPAVIRLASDVELVARDLFCKLVMQMIHWFTSNIRKENPDTMALLESILEGLVDSDNAALREFCAQCFEEFMHWSIRHAPYEADNVVNIPSMLHRLYNRLDHPNPYHRLGAAMAASHLYRVLRGNKSIADKHLFELMFFCMKSLRIGEFDDEQIGTVKQLSKVLDNLLKLVKYNVSSLQVIKKDRRMFLSLGEFLEWLFKQTGRIQEKSRTKCMWLFGSICETISVGSAASWFRMYKGSADVLKLFDIRMKFPVGKNSSSFLDIKNWMRHLNRSLHWFEWALRTEIVNLKDLACGERNNSMTSAITDLCMNLLLEDFYTPKLLSPSEIEEYQDLKYNTVMYLMRFLKEVLYLELGIKEQDILPRPQEILQHTENESLIVKLVPVNDPKFHRLLCLIMLVPKDVGLISISFRKSEDLSRIVMKVIKMLAMVSSRFKEGYFKSLHNLLMDGKPELDLQNISASLSECGHLRQISLEQATCLLKGFQQLLLAGFLIPAIGKDNADILGERIMYSLFSVKREFPPALEPVVLEMLTLSVALGVKVTKLLELVLDPEIVTSSSNTNFTAGTIFYFNFRKVIIQQIKFSYKECLSSLLKKVDRSQTARLVISALLDDYIRLSTHGNDITLGSFLHEFLQHLIFLAPCCAEEASLDDKLFFLEVLHKILILDSHLGIVLNPKQCSFQFVLQCYLSLVENACNLGGSESSSHYLENNVIVKSNALVLIPFFFKASLSADIKNLLTNALTKVVTNHLLVREVDLPTGSNQRSMYTQLLSKLLESISLSNSLELLEVLFPLLQNPTKVVKQQILEALEVYVENIEDKRESACDFCIEILKDHEKTPNLKQVVIEYVFSAIMNAAPIDFAVAWYSRRIKDFVNFLNRQDGQAWQNAEKEREYLVAKICHYRVVEILFRRGNPSIIKEKITPLVSNQLLMQVATNDSRAKNDPGTYLFPENADLWRLLHVFAYNCLAAIVMCTQDQEKIFAILFKDFAGRPLWQHLINCSKVYDNFPVEASQLGTANKLIAGLQIERRVKKRLHGAFSSLSSQYLVGGTLSQEPVLIETFVGREARTDQEMGSMPRTDEEQNVKQGADELVEKQALDQDDFDLHPCMPTILNVIEHLHLKFGVSLEQNHEMPDWMKSLHSTLENSVTHINIRLFLCKVVIKARKIFSPFAGFWFRPLVQTILIEPEKSGGKSFHYMLRDICITILEWGLECPPSKDIASSFVNYLMTVTPHESKQVLQANVEIIKLFLARWKNVVVIDRKILTSYLNVGGKNPSPNDKTIAMKKSVGLQLLGAVVEAGSSWFDDVSFVKDFCNTLLSCVSYKVKNIYEASAELVGIFLKQQKEQSRVDDQMLESPLRQMLVTMFKEGEAQFLCVMDKITMHFPSFLEGYSSLVFDLLPRVHGVFRITALDIILRCPSSVPNMPTIVLPYLSKLISHSDELAQLKSLQLVAEIVKEVSKEIVSEKILPLICDTFSTHENVDCRLLFSEVLVFLYTQKKMEEKRLIHSLLVGLSDSASIVRETLQTFWNEQLSRNLQQRFLQILNEMHDPELEEHWASYANNLILKLCEDSVDFKRPIFSAPLSNCEFREYTFDRSLLSGTLPMTPMFSDAQKFTIEGSSMVADEVDTSGIRHGGMVRATVGQYTLPSLSQSQGSIFSYTLGDQYASQVPKDSSTTTLRQDGGVLFDNRTKLKRRFFHPAAARSQTIRGVLNAMKRKEAHASRQAIEQANKVEMMRHYRIGELPDIEINHEEIIRPLVTLAERDSVFSNILIAIICRSLYALPPDGKHQAEKELKHYVTKGIENALERSHNSITFVGCALSIALQDKEAWINPKIVGSASKKSTNYQSGILFLENAILKDNAPWQHSGTSHKRHKGVSGQVTRETPAMEEAWLELANLYKCIGENDIVLSLYKKHLTNSAITHQALQAQLGGKSAMALQLYDKAINEFDQEEASSPGEIEQDLWYVQRLHCLADLLDWRGVMEEILFQVGESNLQRMWEPKVQDPYLSFFIRASIKLPAYHSLLADFLQSAFEDQTKRELILKDFGIETSTLSVINDDIDRARFYVQNCYRSFRKQWTEVHPLTMGTRHRISRQLQRTVELDEFINVASNFCQTDAIRLIANWRTRWPSANLDDAEAWDDIVQNRLLFFQKLQSFFNRDLKGDEDEAKFFVFQLDKERANIYQQAAKGVMKQQAYDVAKVYMNQCIAAHGRSQEKEKFDFDSYKDVIKLRCRQALSTSEIDKNKAIQMLHQVQAYIQTTGQNSHQQRQFKWRNGLRLLQGDAYSALGRLTLELIPWEGYVDTESINRSLEYFGSAFKVYSDALQEMLEINAAGFSSRTIAKASLKFAFFCDELLTFAKSPKCGNQVEEILQSSTFAGLPPASLLPTLIVKHILKAVQLDSSIQAHHGIARVLTLVGQYVETQIEFSASARQIPSWLFLAWIPQLLAFMDKEEGKVFIDILEDIAKVYPQALYFAFNVSKADFGQVGLNRTKHLAAILRNPILENLTRALEDLTFPEQRLRDGLAHIRTCLETGNWQEAQQVFCYVFEDCLSVEALMKRNSGEYNLKFAKDYSTRVLKALGEKGRKLLTMDEKVFVQVINEIMTSLQKALRALKVGKLSLGSLSKWMADFDQSRDLSAESFSLERILQNDNITETSDFKIEIFGKYNGFQKPDPSLDVKLVGFDQTLICLNSKQRPKILKLRGSDEAEYKYVVKGGEDLRLDQRIEQLFEVMNNILHRNTACSQRKLLLRTYAVIPVSKQCGLLQFVENTCVLEDIVKDGLTCLLVPLKQSAKIAPTELLSNLRMKYQEWLVKRGGSQNPVECYRTLYTRAKRDEIMEKLNSLSSELPWDALKTGLFRLTTSAESFIALRSQYQHSLAAMSICGYVAGVGDRHLSNTLVDIKNGSLVPIDFGYSFGTGVILLPVPELVPFRMTHQLINVMHPQDTIGLLRTDMMHTMSALHSSRNIISAVLDVFVKEPLVEWKTEAMKAASWKNIGVSDRKSGVAAAAMGREDLQDNYEQQHVELKIEHAHRKLDLWNPAEITISELQSSIHANKPYMGDLEQIVRGYPDYNSRARVQGMICASVQEQVDCLIDQSMDPNILGRIWIGWQPWI